VKLNTEKHVGYLRLCTKTKVNQLQILLFIKQQVLLQQQRPTHITSMIAQHNISMTNAVLMLEGNINGVMWIYIAHRRGTSNAL